MQPELVPKQAITLAMPPGSGTEPLSTHVLEVGPRSFRIALPEGLPVETDRVTLSFPRADAVYTLRCLVIGLGDGFLEMGFPEPEDVQRVQRREYVRVPIVMPVEYDLAPEGKFGPPTRGILQDLSGGGCLLLARETAPLGTVIRLRLDMGDFGVLGVLGRVVRSDAKAQKDGHLTGVNFADIYERDRDRLVKFLFAKMREQSGRKGGRR